MKTSKFIKSVSFLMTVILIISAIAPATVFAAGNLNDTYAGGSYSVNFSLQPYGGGQFGGSVSIINTGDEPITGWSLKFSSDFVITDIWSAEIVSANPNYTIKHIGWNEIIFPNASADFGFNGTYTGDLSVPVGVDLDYLGKETDDNDDDTDNGDSDGEENETDGSAGDFNPDGNGSAGNTKTGPNLSAITSQFVKTNEWQGAYNAELTVTNISIRRIDNWIIQFNCLDNITSMWNGQVIEHNDDTYIVQNNGYNGSIEPGNSVIIGFAANTNGNNGVTDVILLTATESETVDIGNFEVVFTLDSDWGTGFNARFEILNNGDYAIENWSLEFDFDKEIISFWNAEQTEHTAGHYKVHNTQHNSIIPVGGSAVFGCSGNEGNIVNYPSNYVLHKLGEEYTEYEDPDREPDTDNDGLSDNLELILETDPENPDTDGDGISDYDEVIYALTSPIYEDSDHNDILDCNEDHDNDGLTFLQEIFYGTDPNLTDTDGDNLPDGEEVTVYGTNPFNPDTDGDDLNDDDEIKLGFNPLLPDTDFNGILDSDELTFQTVSKEISCDEMPAITGIEIALSATGDVDKTLKVKDMYGINKFSTDLVGLSGPPIDISTTSRFVEAEVTFSYDKSLVDSTTASRLGVLWFNEAEGIYVDMEAVIDTVSGEISFTTDHFSEYSVCDIEAFNAAISDIPVYEADTTAPNANYGGEIITLAAASSKFGVSTSSLTAMSGNNGLYIMQTTAVYNLLDGSQLRIPQTYYSSSILGNAILSSINVDSRRVTIAPYGWDWVYTTYTSSSYDFGTNPDGSRGYLPFRNDMDTVNFGYLDNIGKYFIPASGFDRTDTDKDNLYDVYEQVGMRMSNGTFLTTNHTDPDMDGDGLKDGQEIIRQNKNNGLFVMVSNPFLADSDGDGIPDLTDPQPLKVNNADPVTLSAVDEFISGSVLSQKTFKVTAYAHNFYHDRLLDFKFSIAFENPEAVSVVSLTKKYDWSARHILVDEYATHEWRVSVKEGYDIFNLNYTVTLTADNYAPVQSDKTIGTEGLPIYTILDGGELKTIILNRFINKEGWIDTDSDGLTDADCIDWALIEDDGNGGYILPTLQQYLDYIAGFWPEEEPEEPQLMGMQPFGMGIQSLSSPVQTLASGYLAASSGEPILTAHVNPVSKTNDGRLDNDKIYYISNIIDDGVNNVGKTGKREYVFVGSGNSLETVCVADRGDYNDKTAFKFVWDELKKAYRISTFGFKSEKYWELPYTNTSFQIELNERGDNRQHWLIYIDEKTRIAVIQNNDKRRTPYVKVDSAGVSSQLTRQYVTLQGIPMFIPAAPMKLDDITTEQEQYLNWRIYGTEAIEGVTKRIEGVHEKINGNDDLSQDEKDSLLWNQNKIDKVWDACRKFYIKYNVQIDPRLLIAIVGAEGTGSFNTDEDAETADDGHGTNFDFDNDLKLAIDLVGGKVIPYAYFQKAFSSAREDAFLLGLPGIHRGEPSTEHEYDYDDFLYYLNWETPRLYINNKDFKNRVYAGENLWHTKVREIYSYLAFDVVPAYYTDYALSLGEGAETGDDKLHVMLRNLGLSIITVTFKAVKNGMDTYGNPNNQYTIIGVLENEE